MELSAEGIQCLDELLRAVASAKSNTEDELASSRDEIDRLRGEVKVLTIALKHKRDELKLKGKSPWQKICDWIASIFRRSNRTA